MNLEKKHPMIQNGEKLKFTYLKQPNPMKDTVISFPVRIPKQFDLQKYIDYDIQFQKGFIGANQVHTRLYWLGNRKEKYIGEFL